MSLRCSTATAREASSRRGVALEGSTIRCLSCSRKWVSVLSLPIKRHWRHYSSSSCVPSGILCILSPTSWILPLMDVSCVLLFSSVTQSCLTLCKPMDCSTPGFPVHHQLPKLAQTQVHRVGDAIQSPHPLSSPFPPAFSLSQYQGLFQGVSSSHQVAKVLELQLQHQSFQ